MHSTVIYEANNLEFIIRDGVNPPTAEWFAYYSRLYNNLRTMGVTLSRTISGTGVYMVDGITCLVGTLSLPARFFTSPEAEYIRAAQGDTVMFFLDKAEGEQINEVQKYIFIGRSVLVNGVERALIISKLNEHLFIDAFQNASYLGGFTVMLDSNQNIICDSVPGLYTDLKGLHQDQLRQGLSLTAAPGSTLFSRASPGIGVTVISSIPNRYIEYSHRAVQIQLFVILAISVFSTAVLSLWVSNRITMGLQKLAHNMTVAGGGSMADMIPISGQDEVGRLNQTFLGMLAQIQNLMGSIREKERQKREMEIRVLRAQISPHFLYNSLNTINYLALLQNAQNIHVLASSLIRLLQAAVDVDEVLIPLSDEIEYVRNYLNIQQYRFPEQIGVEYLISPQMEDCLVPKMMIQPIVENALIHGFQHGHENPFITIKAYTLPGQDGLTITVTDNGVGMSQEKIHQVMESLANWDKMRFSGIGISNVNRRIRLQIGEDWGLSIYSLPGQFTTVEIRLPVTREQAHSLVVD